MNLAYLALKKIIPELNEKIISADRLFEICEKRKVEIIERRQKPRGVYAVAGKDEYILIRSLLTQILFHEVLAHETSHACLHEATATFLLRKHQLEAEAFSLVCLMPRTELPRLCRIIDTLDTEIFDQLRRRLKVVEIWNI